LFAVLWSSCDSTLIFIEYFGLEKEISRHFVCFIKPKNKKVSKILRVISAFSLLFGVIFMSLQPVEAGLMSSLSSIFVGDQAYALQANVSSISILEDKNSKDDVNITDDTNINIDNISEDKALSPNIGLMGVSDEKDIFDSSGEDISVYVVRKGDSISQIADMFEVSTNTILWANNMKKGDKLVEGDILMILPVSGVKHTILKGQNLKGIANKYDADISDIAIFNGISTDAELALGDELIIPDAEMVNVEAPKKSKTNSSSSTNKIKTTLKTLVGYFINPVPGYKRVSQRLHGNNGVDLAAPTGTKIVAAASGTVLLARNGYNGGYGNMVIIKHPNGTQTLYAHQSKISTKTGAQVSQGETIGYVGSTGRSTGPHLHYEIRGARNNTLDL
jgi:LysM repeat protein